MSMKKILMISLCLLACFCWALAADQEASDSVKRLLAKDREIREKAKKEIIDERRSTISALLDIVKDSKNNDDHSVELAIFCLGEMRAVESINLLVEKVAFPYGGQGWAKHGFYSAGVETRSTREWYVAVDALLKIGEPCIPGIINKLSETDNQLEAVICKEVLLSLRSPDDVVSLIEKELAQETHSQKRKRLQRFIREINPGGGKTDDTKNKKTSSTEMTP